MTHPDEILAGTRQARRELLAALSPSGDPADIADNAATLAARFGALDDHLEAAGPLPAAWAQTSVRPSSRGHEGSGHGLPAAGEASGGDIMPVEPGRSQLAPHLPSAGDLAAALMWAGIRLGPWPSMEALAAAVLDELGHPAAPAPVQSTVNHIEYTSDQPGECAVTGPGQREAHDLGKCSHYLGQPVRVTREGDWLTCLCGNAPDLDGFDVSTGAGGSLEGGRYDEWDSVHLRCNRCGRVIDQNTLVVVAWASSPEPGR